MSYARLSTKYRPTKFRKMVGQPEVSIVREIVKDRDALPPLLLFCGPSGVGKTTLARIVAAAVHCENPEANGEPCEKCVSCVAVSEDTHVDLYEVDAATYGSADALRELMGRTVLQSSGIKVFVIDEAQSISAQGWNVLLKTFEEPPEDCLFILLTSEPRKVPAKIRTRALRFNLRAIPPVNILEYVSALAKFLNLDVTEDDLNVVTDLSSGSMREALMLLDQCVTSNHTARELFAGTNRSVDYLYALLFKRQADVVNVASEWFGEIGEAKSLADQVAALVTDILMIRAGLSTATSIANEVEYQKVLEGLDDQKAAIVLETVSKWYNQLNTKAHVVLMSSSLYSGIHGATTLSTPISSEPITQNVSRVKSPEPSEKVDMKSALQGF